MKKIYWYLCFVVVSWQHLSAQDSQAQPAAEHRAADYLVSAAHYAALYSGNRQLPFTFPVTNHPYLKEQDFAVGRLSYHGVVYPGVALRWDMYRDELVLRSPVNYPIVLKNRQIDFAEVHGYRIVYLRKDTLAGCPSTGNYILLYTGEYRLLEKPVLQLIKENNTVNNRFVYHFAPTVNFYLQKQDGTYHHIKNRPTLLKTLGTHRKELRRLIRANKLNYKRDAEKMVLQLVKEHEKMNRL